MNHYDVIIPVYWGHVDTLKVGISYIKRNIKPRNIILLGPQSMSSEFEGIEDIVYVDGNTVLENLSKESVRECIMRCTNGKGVRDGHVGWYFQQFIKMAYALKCNDECYLVWDADIIPLRTISFKENEKYNLYYGGSHHMEYYEVMQILFGHKVEPSREQTYVESFMLIDTACMRELLQMIVCCKTTEGKSFWEKILYSICPDKLSQASFSEFETYGEFMAWKYPDKIQGHERLKGTASGRRWLGETPTQKMLDWVAKDLEAINFESWVKTNRLCHSIASFLCGKIKFKRIISIDEACGRFKQQVKYRLKKMKTMWKRR